MPKEIFEIKHFQSGTITTSDARDVPDDAAVYSTNLDSVVENGKLKSIPKDKKLYTISESVATFSGTGTNDLVAEDGTIFLDHHAHSFLKIKIVAIGASSILLYSSSTPDGIGDREDLGNNGPGTYTNVSLDGGSGTGAKATIIVQAESEAVIIFIGVTTGGSGYKVGDNLVIQAGELGTNSNGGTCVVNNLTIVGTDKYVYSSDNGVTWTSKDGPSGTSVPSSLATADTLTYGVKVYWTSGSSGHLHIVDDAWSFDVQSSNLITTAPIKMNTVNNAGVSDLILYDSADNKLKKITDIYNQNELHGTLTDLGVVISAENKITMQNHNKELHVGTGGKGVASDDENVPKWVGYPTHGQWGEDPPTDMLISDAKLELPELVILPHKIIVIGDYMYAIEWKGTSLFKYKISDNTLVKEGGNFIQTTAICKYDNDSVLVLDHSAGSYGTVFKIDTDDELRTVGTYALAEEYRDNTTTDLFSDMHRIDGNTDKLWFSVYRKGFKGEDLWKEEDVDTENNRNRWVGKPTKNPDWFSANPKGKDNRQKIIFNVDTPTLNTTLTLTNRTWNTYSEGYGDNNGDSAHHGKYYDRDPFEATKGKEIGLYTHIRSAGSEPEEEGNGFPCTPAIGTFKICLADSHDQNTVSMIFKGYETQIQTFYTLTSGGNDDHWFGADRLGETSIMMIKNDNDGGYIMGGSVTAGLDEDVKCLVLSKYNVDNVNTEAMPNPNDVARPQYYFHDGIDRDGVIDGVTVEAPPDIYGYENRTVTSIFYKDYKYYVGYHGGDLAFDGVFITYDHEWLFTDWEGFTLLDYHPDIGTTFDQYGDENVPDSYHGKKIPQVVAHALDWTLNCGSPYWVYISESGTELTFKGMSTLNVGAMYTFVFDTAVTTAIDGEFSVTASSATVEGGSSADFQSELKVGDKIIANSITKMVIDITDDDTLIVDSVFASPFTDATPQRIRGSFVTGNPIINRTNDITIVSTSNVDSGSIGIEAEVTFQKYKLTYLYDSYQESPLSTTLASGEIGDDDFSFSLDIRVKDTLINKRVSAINIYRVQSKSSSPSGFYRLVRTIDLDELWKDEDASQGLGLIIGAHKSYVLADVGKLYASYDARTGISETLKNLTPHYGLSTTLNSSMIIGDIWHEDLEDADQFIIKSKIHRFDTYDWTTDFLKLPNKPTAIAGFKGRLYAFDSNTMWKINTNGMYVEDTFDGIGCLGPDSIKVTEFGMCFLDKNNIYLHNGQSPIAIGTNIQGYADWPLGTDYSWYNVDFSTYIPKILFDSKRTSFVILFKSNNSINYFAWAYNLPRKRWDMWDVDGQPISVMNGEDGRMFLSTNNNIIDYVSSNSVYRNWEYVSKIHTFGYDTLDKKIYEIKTIGDDIGIEHYGETSATDVSTLAIPLSDRRQKSMQLKLTGTTVDECDSVSIIYRRMPLTSGNI